MDSGGESRATTTTLIARVGKKIHDEREDQCRPAALKFITGLEALGGGNVVGERVYVISKSGAWPGGRRTHRWAAGSVYYASFLLG